MASIKEFTLSSNKHETEERDGACPSESDEVIYHPLRPLFRVGYVSKASVQSSLDYEINCPVMPEKPFLQRISMDFELFKPVFFKSLPMERL